MPITARDAPKNLPKHAKEIYVSTWNSAYASTCKKRADRDECASKIAWSAVKKKYKKEGEKWSAKTTAKAISEDRIEGYLLVWGTSSERDLVDEYFTPKTNFWLDRWGGKRPLLYDHGRDPGIKIGNKTIKLVGEDAVLGVIDTFKPDEMGLWIEAQLDRRHRYIDYIQQLINSDEGMSLSSGALPTKDFIVKDSDGCIKVWPIIEGSLAPTPCEHRLASVELKATLHALGMDFEEENMQDEKSMWEKFTERLGFSGKSEDDEATLQEEIGAAASQNDAVGVLQAMEKRDGKEKPEEEDEEEKEKEEGKKSMPEFILDESAIKAIGVEVAVTMKAALTEAIVPLQEEVKALQEANKSLVARLEAHETAEKHAEEKAAKIIADLPPIVKVHATGETAAKATEVTGSTESNENLTLSEQRMKEWQEVIASIVRTGMGHTGQMGSIEV